MQGVLGCISMSVRAKHSGREFISNKQRFTAGMLRPYEDICKTKIHRRSALMCTD